MNKRCLFVGPEETWKKVERVAEEFSSLSITPWLEEGDPGALREKLTSSFDAVLTPCFQSVHVNERFPTVPVYELHCSQVALQAALYKIFSKRKENEGLSIDFGSEADVRMQLLEAGFPLEQVCMILNRKGSKVEDLLAHHEHSMKRSMVKTFITTHPDVYHSLNGRVDDVQLIQPTCSCIRTVLKKMSEHGVFASFPSAYPHENQHSMQPVKNIGVSGATISRLIALCRLLGRDRMTAAELAKGFSITLRSARRILATLETNQLAKIVGEEQVVGRGRPRYVYQVNLSSFHQRTSLSALG